MTVIPEVQQAIRDAIVADELSARPKRRRRRWIPVVVTGTGLVAVGSALAAAGVWDPVLGDDGKIAQSVQATPERTGEELAVLRQPARPQDRSVAVREALRQMSSANLDGVHVDGVRLLSDQGQATAILVPVERTGPAGTDDADAHTGLQRYQQLCVVATRPAAPPTESCGDPDQLRAGEIGGFVPRDHTDPDGDVVVSGVNESHYFGLVPDGVARVRVELQDGRELEGPVSDNFYDLESDASAAPNSTTWLNAAGAVIATRSN